MPSITTGKAYIENVDLTSGQRAMVENYGLRVMLEFGHIKVEDPMVIKAFGQASGSIHDVPAKLDTMIQQMVETHKLAERDNERKHAAPAATLNPPRGRPAQKAAAQAAVRQASTVQPAKRGPKPKGTIAPVKVTETTAAKGRALAAKQTTPATAAKSTPKGKPAKAKAEQRPGVINTLVELLTAARAPGKTAKELYEGLATVFPDRATAEKGMRITISVQLNALKKKHNIVSEKVEGKGTCYRIVTK